MNLALDLSLTLLHHLSVLALCGCLAAEWALLRLPASERWVEWLPRVDLAYGLLAALVLAAGVGRVAWGLKGAGFYLANPVFWMKLGLFVVVGLVSVVPTLKYLRWRREHRASGALPGPLEIRRARSWVAAQAGLLAALPLLAALMARGLGL
jgi:putative membrane protein